MFRLSERGAIRFIAPFRDLVTRYQQEPSPFLIQDYTLDILLSVTRFPLFVTLSIALLLQPLTRLIIHSLRRTVFSTKGGLFPWCGNSVKQKIIGFHQDEVGDWVADLECGHTQHVRHDPPWQERPWVITSEGRQSRLGFELECKKCEEGALPEDFGRAGLVVMNLAGEELADSPVQRLRLGHDKARKVGP